MRGLCYSSSSSHGGHFGRLSAVCLFVVNVELFNRLGGSIGLRGVVHGLFRSLCSLLNIADGRGGGVCRGVGGAFGGRRLIRRLLDGVPRLGERADDFSLGDAVLGAQPNARQPLLARDLLPQQGAARERVVSLLPCDDAVPRRIGDAQLAKGIVELTAILLGDVPGLDEGFQGGLHLVGSKHKDLGHGDGVEPALDPAPDGAEEDGRANDEDSVEGFRVMGRGQLGCGLHVAFEVPKLLEPNARDVDNVGAHRHGHVGVLAICQLRAKGLVETRQVLVEGKEPQEAGRRLAIGLGL